MNHQIAAWIKFPKLQTAIFNYLFYALKKLSTVFIEIIAKSFFYKAACSPNSIARTNFQPISKCSFASYGEGKLAKFSNLW
jgi:hypothetical protein